MVLRFLLKSTVPGHVLRDFILFGGSRAPISLSFLSLSFWAFWFNWRIADFLYCFALYFVGFPAGFLLCSLYCPFVAAGLPSLPCFAGFLLCLFSSFAGFLLCCVSQASFSALFRVFRTVPLFGRSLLFSRLLQHVHVSHSEGYGLPRPCCQAAVGLSNPLFFAAESFSRLRIRLGCV